PPGRADAGAPRDELRGLPRGAGPGRHDRGRPDVRVGAGRLLRDPAARAPRARECRQRARGALHRAGRAAAQAAPALSHGRGLAQPVLGARDPARLRERARRVLARGRSEPLILARVGEPRTRPTHWPAHAKFSPDRVNGRSVGVLPDTQGGPLMARAGYRIFDADTHIIEAAEPIEAYLSAGEKAKLASLGSLIGRAPGKAGVSRYRVGKRPELNRLLGSRDPVPPADAITRGLKDGGTPWDVRWQGPPFPDDRVNFDSHARVKDMDIEGVDVNMVLPSGGLAAFSGLDDVGVE